MQRIRVPGHRLMTTSWRLPATGHHSLVRESERGIEKVTGLSSEVTRLRSQDLDDKIKGHWSSHRSDQESEEVSGHRSQAEAQLELYTVQLTPKAQTLGKPRYVSPTLQGAGQLCRHDV